MEKKKLHPVEDVFPIEDMVVSFHYHVTSRGLCDITSHPNPLTWLVLNFSGLFRQGGQLILQVTLRVFQIGHEKKNILT